MHYTKSLSVIIPFHNEISLIHRATDSIVINADEFDYFEILICNDGKYTEEEIRSHVSEASNKAIKILPNQYAKGPGGARNTGIDAAASNLIAFLDADDYWLPGKIRAQMQAIQKGATFVTTGYRFDNHKAVVVPPDRIDGPSDIFLRRGIGTSTVLATRMLIGQKRFKDIRFAQDIDFWFNLAKSPVFHYARITEELVEYSTAGSTKNKWEQLQYLNKVLNLNEVPLAMRAHVLASYIVTGIYNHYIKRL